MNFNLVPWDTEAYLVAADYAEEQGFLLTNSIRNKILPLGIKNSDEKDSDDSNGFGIYEGVIYKQSAGEAYGWGDGYGFGYGEGLGHGFGDGSSYGYGYGYGDI